MKNNYSLIYEIVMSLLALTTVGIALFDLTGHMNSESNLLFIDQFILISFALDYFIR